MASPAAVLARRHIAVRGVVQGVGFRPFVHRLATSLGLRGHVGNDAAEVFIEIEGSPPVIAEFVRRLRTEAPPLAIIESIAEADVRPQWSTEFAIVASEERAGAVTLVSPDTAVCDDCLAEMNDPTDRRFGHPFITCTNCGPRFTIIRGLPYDRPRTTMADFPMCARCAAEYRDPDDRRYHAQPIACHECGPRLIFDVGGACEHRDAAAIAAARRALLDHRVIAIKGIGGFHLACDATSDAAVAMLRRRKGRADKPFAVMVADLDAVRALAFVDDDEAAQLASAARPIVLLRSRAGTALSPLVAPGNPMVGVLLPYSPLHHLLLQSLPPLVMTSGNRTGEPIAHDDDDARRRLADLVDGFLAHDRPIDQPCDDSVVRVVDGHLLPIRRSRGYAPLPVRLHDGPDVPDVLAVGGELKNAFCIATGSHAWMSQHIGDVENLDTLEAFEASVARFCDLYRVEPTIIAVDAHPGYSTSAWARRRHRPGDAVAVVEVQHHHAHIGAVLAEHRRDPAERVIGIAFDGTGYGSDGTIWGGELLIADGGSFTRRTHLACVPLAGGDAAVRNPSRIALAHLSAAGVPWHADLAPVSLHPRVELDLLRRQFASGFGCVPTSSMGRLFDAMSSLLGLRHTISYEAQAAIDLEIAAEGHLANASPYAFAVHDDTFDAAPVVAAAAADVRRGIEPGRIAASFHLAVVALLRDLAGPARDELGLDVVALSGGVFQNATLVRLARTALAADGFEVLTHQIVPPNDGGLALGQAYIARHRARTSREEG